MTFEEKAIKYLTDNGMLTEEAKEVIQTLKLNKSNKDLISRWNDDMEGYPEEFIKLFNFILKKEALKWLNSNLPNAWFKPMFEK